MPTRTPPLLAARLAPAALVAGIGWTVVALWAGPRLVRSAYDGRSLPLVNRLVTGQAVHSLQDHLARWSMLSWSGLGVMLSAGALLLLAARAWPRRVERLGPPLCAFLLVRSLLCLGFAAAPTKQYGDSTSHRWDGSPAQLATGFTARNWSRWDSHVYVSIATAGYEFYPCDVPAQGAPIARQGANLTAPHGWCGNTAWFPAYSGLIWLLARAGLAELTAGVLLSAIFGLLSLHLLWTRFLGAEPSARNLLILLLAAAFPGAVFFHAIFPISMVVFFLLAALHLARARRWGWCGVAGACAAATYPPGAFLVIALPIGIFLANPGATWIQRLRWGAVAGGVTSAGLLLVFLVQRLFLGVWGTFWIAQSAYPSGRDLPIARLIDSVAVFLRRSSLLREYVLSVNTLFVAGLAILLLAAALRARRRREGDVVLIAFLAVCWLLVLSMGDWSLVRKQSILAPAVPLARGLPTWCLAVVVAGAVVLLIVDAALFFLGSLI